MLAHSDDDAAMGLLTRVAPGVRVIAFLRMQSPAQLRATGATESWRGEKFRGMRASSLAGGSKLEQYESGSREHQVRSRPGSTAHFCPSDSHPSIVRGVQK